MTTHRSTHRRITRRTRHYTRRNGNSLNTIVVLLLLLILLVTFLVIWEIYWAFKNREIDIDIFDDDDCCSLRYFRAEDGDSIRFSFNGSNIRLTYYSDSDCGHGLTDESFSLNRYERVIHIKSVRINNMTNGTKVTIKHDGKTYSFIVKNKHEDIDIPNLYHFDYNDK